MSLAEKFILYGLKKAVDQVTGQSSTSIVEDALNTVKEVKGVKDQLVDTVSSAEQAIGLKPSENEASPLKAQDSSISDTPQPSPETSKVPIPTTIQASPIPAIQTNTLQNPAQEDSSPNIIADSSNSSSIVENSEPVENITPVIPPHELSPVAPIEFSTLSQKNNNDYITAREWNTLLKAVKDNLVQISTLQKTAEETKSSESETSAGGDSAPETNDQENEPISQNNILFQSQTWDFKDQKGSAAVGNLTFNFEQNVTSAEAFIKSWRLEYKNREFVKEAGIQLLLQTDNKQVLVTVKAPLKDASGIYDDAYSGEITVVVLAKSEIT